MLYLGILSSLLLLVLYDWISLFIIYNTFITFGSKPLDILYIIIPIRFKINLSSGSIHKSIKSTRQHTPIHIQRSYRGYTEVIHTQLRLHNIVGNLPGKWAVTWPRQQENHEINSLQGNIREFELKLENYINVVDFNELCR